VGVAAEQAATNSNSVRHIGRVKHNNALREKRNLLPITNDFSSLHHLHRRKLT
jgi:hypothetical protein